VNFLRRVFGERTSHEREQRQAEIGQLTVNHKRTLERAERLVPRSESARLAAAIKRTVHAVRGGD
jgi:hypothetical protein